MGPRDRRERERADTRARILDAAREMFVERGVESVTMRAIAQRIEYTPTAIYHHFRDKDALITELCNRDFLALAARFQRYAKIEDPIERLRCIGDAYVEFAVEHPMQYQFMFMTRHHDDVFAATMAATEVTHGNPEEDAYEFLRWTVAQALESGRFLPEYTDVHECAQLVWGAIHGVVSLHIAKENDPWITWRDAKTTARRTNRALLRGMLRPGDPYLAQLDAGV